MKKKLVVLTGAGISQESGIKTFRDSGGLWENHKIEDVASPRGWQANKELVLDFYNQRRRQLATVEPNEGHNILVKLEEFFDVQIITQNIDDLHERAGSSNILHLHGELTKARSSLKNQHIKNIGYEDINLGDLCEDGSQMRPHIVWFDEHVPEIPKAEDIVCDADIFLIIGTSLNVYPAAGLVTFTDKRVPIYIIDPNLTTSLKGRQDTTTIIKKTATEGLAELYELLTQELKLQSEIVLPEISGWYWVFLDEDRPIPCWYSTNNGEGCFLPGGLGDSSRDGLFKDDIIKIGPEITEPKF